MTAWKRCRSSSSLGPWLVVALIASAVLPGPVRAGSQRSRHEAPGHLTWASPQAQPIAAAPDGSVLCVAATTSNRVELLDRASLSVLGRAEVGMEPVSVAITPDGTECWVSNHVSDSVSVVDIVPSSASFLQVVETVQDVDGDGVTRFDEPVGIAFKEDGSRAYVALSSRNDVAVVDTATYQVTGRLHITAQEPRALAVRGGRLYVVAFESGNQTEISWCENLSDDTRPDQCTLAGTDFGTFAVDPNMPGESKNIVVDDDVPDRDLFVFDTSDDSFVEAVEGVGTLLYGLAVSSTGRVFVAQTHARNAENGLDSHASSPSDRNGDGKVNLADLDNRLFLNQLTRVDCGGSCGSPTRIELEPAPPTDPAPGTQLATPYGVALSSDDALLLLTAAASSRIASLDAVSGAVLDRLDVGAIPRGVALMDDGDGTHTAFVLNTLDNSVSVVDVDGETGALSPVSVIAIGSDPTPEAVRLGRIAFNDAEASSTGTFSCASCHPDGNVDQVLWRIGGECFLDGCVAGEDEPRATMPIRGLRDTLPLHWDGSLGDPFAGPNGAVGGGGSAPANCNASDPEGCTRQLVDASQSGVMCDQASCPIGPSGLPGPLTATERDHMATFLLSVSYPPARSRAMDDDVSPSAELGFRDFFTDVGGAIAEPDTCADSNAGCHELPLGTATGSETLEGFDAPTMRGLTDRTLQFSAGPTSTEELLLGANDGFTIFLQGIPFPIPTIANPFGDWSPGMGPEEEFSFGVAFGLFDRIYGGNAPDIFQMFEEASTGHSGALGRQVTLNTTTTAGCPSCPLETLLAQLEAADARGVVNLRGWGLRDGRDRRVSYLAQAGEYKIAGERLTRAELVDEAQAGTLLLTLTGHLRDATSEDTPQPLIAPLGAQCGTGDGPSGDPALPTGSSFQLEASHVSAADEVFLDGQPTSASITLLGGASACTPVETTTQRIRIDGLSRSGGLQLLQIRSVSSGLLSNEMPLP